MAVRQLGPGDVETLRTIRLEALRSDPDAFGSTLERELGRSDDDWRAWLARGATFVAEDDAGPNGVIVAIPQDDPRIVGIFAMFVSDRVRREGVGKALLQAAVGWAASTGAERAALMVVEGNEPAASLYEACGFVYSGPSALRDRDGAIEREMIRVIR
ncbi:MAG TPA: GNAT family N-acetyltransferase [Acidimicrobiales bacterium]|nr:GNAT family N-acetyltransferase [Acidimicrobiales bacterium]